jgi:phosphatidylserine decarboxylase
MTFTRLKVLLQYLAPQHLLSSLAGWLSNCRWHWLKSWEINYFITRYAPDLNEAVLGNIEDYPTFNSFFTRYLKPECRPIAPDAYAIVSPADGGVSQIGVIKNDTLLQAKGFDFRLKDLLGGNEEHARAFVNGSFATIYLAPKDYHRVHMPMTGTLRETIFIPGDLFSVNQNTVNHVPHLFARNERLVCLFDTAEGLMAVILVGAMLVGSIKTVWNNSTRAGKISVENFSGARAITLEKGAELGHFEMGSTAILLFPSGKIAWLSDLRENAVVRMGTIIAKIRQP